MLSVKTALGTGTVSKSAVLLSSIAAALPMPGYLPLLKQVA
jgi:hypothetical protein